MLSRSKSPQNLKRNCQSYQPSLIRQKSPGSASKFNNKTIGKTSVSSKTKLMQSVKKDTKNKENQPVVVNEPKVQPASAILTSFEKKNSLEGFPKVSDIQKVSYGTEWRNDSFFEEIINRKSIDTKDISKQSVSKSQRESFQPIKEAESKLETSNNLSKLNNNTQMSISRDSINSQRSQQTEIPHNKKPNNPHSNTIILLSLVGLLAALAMLHTAYYNTSKDNDFSANIIDGSYQYTEMIQSKADVIFQSFKSHLKQAKLRAEAEFQKDIQDFYRDEFQDLWSIILERVKTDPEILKKSIGEQVYWVFLEY